METLKRYKATIVGLVLIVGLYFVYVQFIQGTSNDPLLSSNTAAGIDGAAAGQEIIGLLNEIKAIKLDTSIFENHYFTELTDYRTDITPEGVGRTNPFEPIGFGIDKVGNTAYPTPEQVQEISPVTSSDTTQ